MPFAEINGTRLFYTDDGDGDPPLVLVHGWTCDSLDWSWQLSELSAHHRVIAVDNRGHGRSAATGDYRPRTFAADLAALLDELGAGPVVAIGHSLGAMIVSALAIEHPSLVDAVVAVDGGYGIDGELAELVRGLTPLVQGAGALQVVTELFAGIEGPATPPALVWWHRRRVLGMPQAVVTETWNGQWEAEDQFAFRPQADRYLSRRSCPVLAIYVDPARAAWEATTFQDPYSRAVSWEGSGHWLHQERPGEFNALTLGWIAGLRSRSSGVTPPPASVPAARVAR